MDERAFWDKGPACDRSAKAKSTKAVQAAGMVFSGLSPDGALPEIVIPGRTGFFMTTVSDGVAAVRRLPELSRSDCRRDAEARFSVGTCGRQYLELYARSRR